MVIGLHIHPRPVATQASTRLPCQRQTAITFANAKGDSATNIWPSNVFSVKTWTKIYMGVTDDGFLEVSTVDGQQSYIIKATVEDVCGSVGVQVFQVTATRLSWDCSKQCVSQLITVKQDVDMAGKSTNILVLPKENFHLVFILVIKNCVNNEKYVQSKAYSEKKLNLKTGIWHNVSVEYKIKVNHSYSITVDEQSTNTFTGNREVYNCDQFVKFKLSAKDLFLAPGGCKHNMYMKNNAWKAHANKCSSTSVAGNPQVAEQTKALEDELPTPEWSHLTEVISKTSTTTLTSSISFQSVFGSQVTREWAWAVFGVVLLILTLSIHAVILTVKVASHI